MDFEVAVVQEVMGACSRYNSRLERRQQSRRSDVLSLSPRSSTTRESAFVYIATGYLASKYLAAYSRPFFNQVGVVVGCRPKSRQHGNARD